MIRCKKKENQLSTPAKPRVTKLNLLKNTQQVRFTWVFLLLQQGKHLRGVSDGRSRGTTYTLLGLLGAPQA